MLIDLFDSMTLPKGINQLAEKHKSFALQLADKLYAYSLMRTVTQMGSFTWEDALRLYRAAIRKGYASNLAGLSFGMLEGIQMWRHTICKLIAAEQDKLKPEVGTSERDIVKEFSRQFDLFYIYNWRQSSSLFAGENPERSARTVEAVQQGCPITNCLITEYFYSSIWTRAETARRVHKQDHYLTFMATNNAFAELQKKPGVIKQITDIEPFLQQAAERTSRNFR